MKEEKALNHKLVDDWMREMASMTTPIHDLPAPGLILFKSRLAERQLAAKRAALPIAVMRIAAVILMALIVLWLFVRDPLSIGSLLGQSLASIIVLLPILLAAGVFAAAICFGLSRYMSDEGSRR